VAYKQKVIHDLLLRIALVIECKSSRQKPWILFSSQSRMSSRALVAQRAASGIGRRFLRKAAQYESVQMLPLFRLPAEPAYNFTQAFTSGDDVCYASAMSVAQATLAISAQRDRLPPPSRDVLEVDFPVIVTDARLLSVKLNVDNSVSIEDVIRGALVWRNPVIGMPHTIIQIVSLEALPSFAEEMQISIDCLINLCSNQLNEVVAAAAKP